ncbi:beta-N-acetylhexosaminidase [Roseibium aggregatum]|uniref:beta-N-acetylhexosaminidase n=1 Tax=Roseibium aggregatum TaxID=187304 RepID=A0A926S4E3_9HYPH|nr:beta-N-acetylhexosaminidase [Roseibium aggregatum]MBD1546293.1 beta-N-acetylhexosaminidase [Roseibium aggregatum]
MIKAFISGCSRAALTPEETAFFREENPWGLILFRRNCEAPDQVAGLVASFRDAVGRSDAPVLIDQEGGRVQRLRPPNWPSYPTAGTFGTLYEKDRQCGMRAAWLGARLIAHDLLALGITVDCLPLLDLRLAETVDAIGDRAYSSDPETVAALGRATCEGLLAGGVLPVIKHLPGHGRAKVDSHLELPRISASRQELSQADFLPFKALADMPLAMTAHLLYLEIEPQHPATQSPTIIQDIIRGEIGFDGCLMSDDISMKALGGDMRERAALSFAAGCDLVLHCNGDMAEMKAVADAAPALQGKSLQRCDEALAKRKQPDAGFDPFAAREEFDELLSDVPDRAVG